MGIMVHDSAHKFLEGTPLGTTVLLQCLLQNACYLHELDYSQLRRQSGLFIIQSVPAIPL